MNAAYKAVDGGVRCRSCGAEYQTPLGIARHRELCNRGEH